MRDGVQPTLCCACGRCVECHDGICNAPVSTMELGRAQLRHRPRRSERPPSLSGGLGASNSNTPPCSLPDMRSGGQNTRASIAEECAAAGGARWIHPSSQPCNSAPMFSTGHATATMFSTGRATGSASHVLYQPCRSGHATSHVVGAMQLTMSMDIATPSRNFFSGVTL